MKNVFLGIICAALFPIASANADLITECLYEADFSDTGVFVDGEVNGQDGFTETQAGYIVDTTAGTLANANGTFVRAQYGPNSLEGQTVAVGDMMIVEATDFNVSADNNGNQVFILGLGGGGSAGAAQVAIGSQLTTDGTSLFVENTAFGVDTGGRVDTGFDIGTDTFDYAVKMTAETAGGVEAATYQIDHIINGTSILTETGQAMSVANPGTSTTLSGFMVSHNRFTR